VQWSKDMDVTIHNALLDKAPEMVNNGKALVQTEVQREMDPSIPT
jgi:copper homeostasis protein CutC